MLKCVHFLFPIDIAINSANLSADPVVYVSSTALVDISAYLIGILVVGYIGRKRGCFTFFGLAAISFLGLLLIPQDSKAVLVSIAMLGRFGVSAAYAIIGLYTTELFPTEVRSSGIGVSSMIGHIGSMIAPFAVDFLVNIVIFLFRT